MERRIEDDGAGRPRSGDAGRVERGHVGQGAFAKVQPPRLPLTVRVVAAGIVQFHGPGRRFPS